jgi:hypothetical protein
MKRSKFSEEQVAYALRHVEGARRSGMSAVSEAALHAWKNKYAHLGVRAPPPPTA